MMRQRKQTPDTRHGPVVIIAARSSGVPIGFAGPALGVGRLYVKQTELQNAADACLLAATFE